MLLFSTLLSIDDFVTKGDFINLVIEWNDNHPYDENRIKGIAWNGEKDVRFGDDKLWLEIVDYTNKNIVAVRYEKVTEDGVIWDTDYIMNLDERKLSIQLERSYREDALVTNAVFSTPLFISYLIDHGYLRKDGELKVDKRPVYITGDNLDCFAAAISGRAKVQRPIVFVSKTAENKDPVDVNLLASRLKGAAHVFVQEDRETNKDLRIICNEENAYNGAIGIYYPNEVLGHKRFMYRDIAGIDNILLDRVLNYVLQFGKLQLVDKLYSWQGVNNAILNESLVKQMEELQKAEHAKAEAQNEVADVYATLDEELQELQQKVEKLTRRNEALLYENQGLAARLSQNNSAPLLFRGDEEEAYQGEIKDLVLSCLADAAGNAEDGSRRKDVLTDIVQSNEYQRLAEEKRQQLKRILRGYKSVSATMKQELMNLGFEISEEGKHYKLTYHGDTRYVLALAKTPSDHKTGDNMVADISRKVF